MGLVACLLGKKGEMIFCFDALGDHRKIEPMPKPYNSPDTLTMLVGVASEEKST